jgi:exopolyphosphatase/guanosine-5'-triphosphate,3'-diphosphate pyrophosphatase
MNQATPTVAVIDIGSNSIKALVASRDSEGQLIAIEQRTLDSRISTGISREDASLSSEGLMIGESAVAELWEFVKPHGPQYVKIVATSAVREAANRAEFARRVRQRTGEELRILTGQEEAQLIGRGLLCDPALSTWQDFQVFDLGGGSLECLTFAQRKLTHATSLPLGCVRLTEKFVADREAPFPAAEDHAIRDHVKQALARAEILFSAGISKAVFSGGTMTSCRAILAEAEGIPMGETSPQLTTTTIASILAELGRLPLAERIKIPGLPDRRADVMTTALATVLALAAVGGFTAFQHSFYNLRWGIADSLLPPSD